MRCWRATIATAAFLLVCAPAHAGDYRAGVGKVVITPTEPMWAAGYGHRDRPTAEALHDLHAKALVLEDARGTRLVIVTTDLLGLPRDIAEPVAARLMQRFQLRREQIVLTSSHTHCGPVLAGSLVDIYPLGPDDHAPIERYSVALPARIVEAVSRAMAALQPVSLSHAIGKAGFAVNRRENPEAKVVPGYEPKGPVDHDVPVLRVARADGTLLAVLFGYACHCTTLSFYQWCGDYAGFAQAELEERHPGTTALFFAGCGADQNPLPRRTVELCRGYGHQLAGAVEKVLAGSMDPVQGELRADMRHVTLAFERAPTRAELEAQREGGTLITRNRAKRFLSLLDAGGALPASYDYPVQAVQVGRELTLVALAGEVVVDYALRIKRELGPSRTWVAAYANDVFAYIPSERVLKEGGYEGDTSMAVYGQPARWAPGLEQKIMDAVHAAVNAVRIAPQPATSPAN